MASHPQPQGPARRRPDAISFRDSSSRMPALALVGSVRGARIMARVLGVCFVAVLLGVVFLPWQQFVHGSGRVVAYDPLDRVQVVEAPLPGRVAKSFVVEGHAVKQGETLFEIVDNDPNLIGRLELQRAEAIARKAAVQERLDALGRQIDEQQRSLSLAMDAARTRLDAARFAADAARLQFDRIESLYKDRRGLASQREFELATLERDRTVAELVRADADLKRTETDALASINSSKASRESARSDLASAAQSIVSLDILIQQTSMQRVVAPRDGIVFRVQATEGTFLRAGSPLCTIIPETDSRMVELLLEGNDMPLVTARETDPEGRVLHEGSPVRIQFEGWPAIQFVGWPSVAVGTFGGEVVLVDPTDNGKGQFRVLVAPKPDVIEKDGHDSPRPWPGTRWLRQGVRANGWVLLRRVPLWFEIWRRINGFPPVVDVREPSKPSGTIKR